MSSSGRLSDIGAHILAAGADVELGAWAAVALRRCVGGRMVAAPAVVNHIDPTGVANASRRAQRAEASHRGSNSLGVVHTPGV